MKREHLRIAKASNHAPTVRTRKGVGSVVHQAQLVPVRDLLQRLNRTGPAPHVHAENARGARRNQAFHLCRIQVVRSRIDITKDGRDLLPLERMRRGHKGEGGHDDLACQAQSTAGDLQGHGGVTHGDAVSHPDQVGNTLLELAHVGAVVAEPAAVQHVIEPFVEPAAVANVGPTNVERLGKGRPAAHQGQSRCSVRNELMSCQVTPFAADLPLTNSPGRRTVAQNRCARRP